MIPAELWRDRAFRIGLAVRIAAVILIVPTAQAEWFTPFMRATLGSPGFDPWTLFLQHGGSRMAFPYGPAMYLFHAPTVAVGMGIDALLKADGAFAQIGFAASLLTADLALLVVLYRLTGEARAVVLYYWLSPIVLFVTYWIGQTDVVPTLLLTLSLLLLKQARMRASGAILGLSVAAKVSTLLAVPFVILFLWKNRRYRGLLLEFAVAFAAVALLVQGPALLSPGLQVMLLANPEIQKIYEIAIPLAGGVNLYVVPICYALLLFGAWRIGRMNFELLYAFMGASFFLILLLTPASVGWFLWIVPFLVVYQLNASEEGRAVALAFSLAFVASKLLVWNGPSIAFTGVDLHTPPAELFPNLLTPHVLSLALSGLTALGLVVAATMLQRALTHNDFFQISRQPLTIGIAGDSGSGKDSLSIALAGLFGENAVTRVSGDDYHLFERTGPLWQSVTHLDPRGNDLDAFTSDSLSLIEGRAIYCRHYDHQTGLFTQRRLVQARDVILVSGLHALYPTALRERMNVSIFLDMDEKLRRYFKVRRDVDERGHSVDHVLRSIETRRADFHRWIDMQAAQADIVFSLQPVLPHLVEDYGYRGTVPLRLRVFMRSAIGYDESARVLIALCGLRVDVALREGSAAVEMVVDGEDVSADDIAFAAVRLVPHLDELLAIRPAWRGGMLGIMQLFTLLQIAENARKHS